MRKRLRTTARLVFAVMAIALLSAFAVACDDDDDDDGAEVPTLEIGAAEFAFTVSGDMRPGVHAINLVNSGAEAHHAQIISLAEGHTMDEAVASLSDPTAPIPEWIGFVGGPSVQPPGGSGTVYADLAAGTYGLLCFVSGDDEIPHFAKGMVAEFTVEGDAVEAEAPEANVSVNAVDSGDGTSYSFEAPATDDAGELVIAFANNGSEPHEMAIERLPEGFTAEDYVAIVAGTAPPPEGVLPESFGGVQAILPGAPAQTAVVSLEAGEYVLVCFVPNATGAPHAAFGMVQPLTVQ
jgi:uncharacterized cupredoxin-like copper-binding protein